MIPPVVLSGGNLEDETQTRKQAMHGAEAETGEVDAYHWLPNKGTDHRRLDAGHQLEERNLENCGTKLQEGASPRPQRAGRSGDVGDERLLGPVPLLQAVSPLLHREEHTGGLTAALGMGDQRRSEFFFDGGVNSPGESRQGRRFPIGTGWVLQTPETWETGHDPKRATRLESLLCHGTRNHCHAS